MVKQKHNSAYLVGNCWWN